MHTEGLLLGKICWGGAALPQLGPAAEPELADRALTEQILESVAGVSTPLSREVPHCFDRRERHGSEKRHIHFCELF